MRSQTPATDKQVQQIRQNWARIERFTPAGFVALTGTALFLFMVLCWIGFVYAHGRQRVLRMPFVWEASLPCMAFLSFFWAACWVMILRSGIRRVGKA